MSDSAERLNEVWDTEPPKMTFVEKTAFGVGDLGTAIAAGILTFYQLFFLTNVAGLSPVLAGSIRTIASVWDAVNDPITGMLSDRTRTRWGRRYPWMLAGAIPLGIFFFLQWIVPQFSQNSAVQQSRLFWFYLIASVFFNMAYTAVNVPYTALTAELTRDYDERTALNQFRFVFSIGGMVLVLILAQVIFSSVPSPAQQYLLLGGICAVFCIVPPFLCAWGTYRRSQQANESQVAIAAPLPYFQQLRIVFSNRPFLFVVGIYFFSWLAIQNTAAIIPYFIQDWMRLPAQHSALVPLTFQTVAVLALALWGKVSHRYGKRIAYFAGTGCWALTGFLLFFLQPGQVVMMYFLGIFAGLGISTCYLIPWSLLPDVIELDELNTGHRREGIFYGFMVFLQKIGLAVGQFLVGLTLQVSGFREGVDSVQPDAALFAIRLLIGPIPAIALLCGMLLVYFYPITREVHAEILLKLKERGRNVEQAGE